MIAEQRLLDKPWRYYDTAHVTYTPRLMTMPEMEEAYDWFYKHAYGSLPIARRSLRGALSDSLGRVPAKMLSTARTDYGYRRTYAWRHVQGEQLLNMALPTG